MGIIKPVLKSGVIMEKTVKFKLNDNVYVNERTWGRRGLVREWYGKVVAIFGDCITIKDTNKKSVYYGQTFHRHIDNVEKKEN